MSDRPETEREFSYRLIIGHYSTETKIAELNRRLDEIDRLRAALSEREVKLTAAEKRAEGFCDSAKSIQGFGEKLIQLVFKHRWEKVGGEELRDHINRWDLLVSDLKSKPNPMLARAEKAEAALAEQRAIIESMECPCPMVLARAEGAESALAKARDEITLLRSERPESRSGKAYQRLEDGYKKERDEALAALAKAEKGWENATAGAEALAKERDDLCRELESLKRGKSDEPRGEG